MWPLIFKYGQKIHFAYSSFKWSNLANHNAGVSVVIVGLSSKQKKHPVIYSIDTNGNLIATATDEINPYLTSSKHKEVYPTQKSLSNLPSMFFGNMPRDGGHFILSFSESEELTRNGNAIHHIRIFVGSKEFVTGTIRKCLWIDDRDIERALDIPGIKQRVKAVREFRQNSKSKSTRSFADQSHRFVEIRLGKGDSTIIVPSVTSEKRPYLPVGLIEGTKIVSNRCFVIYDEELWSLGLLASRVHLVWIGAVCGRLETRFSYSNTLGWNTFPVPKLTSKNKEDLTRAAENILLAREEHFPATIADMYKPDQMPENLRIAHEQNDEIIERIFIGRRFRNDTERLEKLFELYSKMTGQVDNKQKGTNH